MTPAVPPPSPTSAPAPSRLASPIAMAVVLPLLVLASGIAIGWVTRASLRAAAENTAATALVQSTRRTSREISQCLDQAAPILGALQAWMRSTPDLSDERTVARTLLAIVRGRPGVAMAMIGTADGSFHGVEQRGNQWTYQWVGVTADGGTPRRTWRLDERLDLVPESTIANSDYDVRQRPFYLAAQRTHGRIWTEPYPFFASGLTGFTCAEPLAVAGPTGDAIAGVAAVDFDLESLGAILQQVDGQLASHSFLFTSQRVLVGLPAAWRPAARPDSPRRRLTVDDLANPTLSAYFAALPALNADDQLQPTFLVQADGHEFAATAARIPLGDAPWYVGMLLPRENLMGEADRHLRLSLVIGLAVLALTSGVALWFARHLARSRAEASVARARAHEAEAAASDLGSYRLVKLLGKGGMGEVWLARHRMLARPAAIKLIKAETLVGRDPERREEIRKRFTAEARITANLRSRNTIELYDYGIADDGTFYYVMELLEGIDLFDLVLKHGRLPPARVVHLLVQACHSLAEAHDRGLVHRDIKPENLFVCRRADEVEVLKVLDFGIVRMQEPSDDMAKTRQGLVQGTPATMSPEQATDQPLDGRSDLYSLGCVAYWLLTGRAVFDQENPMELLTAHVQTPPVPPSKRLERPLPAALEQVVMSCLAKNPHDRPADARMLERALRAADLAGEAPWGEAEQQAWWQAYLPAREIAAAAGDDLPQVFRLRAAGKAK